jgi:hypothetical protein
VHEHKQNRREIYVGEYISQLGSGAGWVGGEIEETTPLASKVEETYTVAINTNTDLERWMTGSNDFV